MVASIVLDQVSFRARDDDVALNSAVFTHLLNANFSWTVGTSKRLRVTIAETNGGMANNIAYSLQYQNITQASGWLAIGDTAPVRSAISALFANADPTTQVISTGTFVAGAGYEQTTTSNITLSSSRTEIEWCLALDSAQVENGDQLQLRVIQDTGTVLQTYTATPTITVVEAATEELSFGVIMTDAAADKADLAEAVTETAEFDDATSSEVEAFGPTPIAAVNTNAAIDAGTIFLLRFRVENTGGEGATGFKLRRSHNGGGYVDVTTTSAVAEAVAAVAFADGDDSLEVLGGSGTYITDNNAGSETGGFTLPANFPASGAVEPVFAVRIVAADVVDDDTVAFRIYNGDDTELDGYTFTPTITVVEAATEDLSFGVVLTDAAAAEADLEEAITETATFDDSTVSAGVGPTPIAAVNTDAELDVDTTYLLRVRVENTGGAGGTDFRWSYNHNSAGFLPVTTTSSAIKAVAAASFANDEDVPEVLGGSGTYLSDNNAGSEDGTTTLGAAFLASGAVEFVLAFQIVGADVADAQTGQIRLELGDGTDLDAYTNTLTYTVNSAAATEDLTFGLDADAALAAAAAVDESTTEASVAADSVATVAEAAEAITEAAALADASAAVQDLDGLFDAPLIADFVIAESQDSGAAVDAAATFDDAATAAAAVVAATTEAVALDDAETELAAGVAVLSEPAELVDEVTAAQALTGSLDAALVADASQSSDSDAAEVVTEAATLADAAAADVAFVGTVTEQLILDDVAASTALEFPTPVEAVNTDADLVVGPTYIIVARVKNTGLEGGTDFRWSHNHNADGWVPVGTAEEAWSDGEEFSDGTGWLNVGAVIAVPAVTFDNDDDVPEILGGPETYLADNNAATEDGTTTLPSNFPASGAVEFALAFQLRSGAVNNDETGQIRVERGDGTPLTAYDFTFTYMVVGGVTAEVLTFGLLLGKTPTAKAAIDETVDLVAALADARTAVAEVDEALAVAAAVADAVTAAAAASEILPASALEAATEHVGLSGPTGESDAPLAAGDVHTASVAASEATTEGVIGQDSATAAAALMEAIVADSVLDDTAIGDTATAIEIVEAVDLTGTQAAVAALAAEAPAGVLEAATAQTAVSALSGARAEALAAGDDQVAIAAASEATTAAALFDDTAGGDTAGSIEIAVAVGLAGAQVAVSELDGVVPASASFASDLAARAAVDETLVAPSAFADAEAEAAAMAEALVAAAAFADTAQGDTEAVTTLLEAVSLASDQVAVAALAEVVVADATLAADHAALTGLSETVAEPGAFALAVAEDAALREILALAAEVDDAATAVAEVTEALTAPALILSSFQGDTQSEITVTFAVGLGAAQSERADLVESTVAPMAAEVAQSGVVTGDAVLIAAVDLATSQTIMLDGDVSLFFEMGLETMVAGVLGIPGEVVFRIEAATIMESTPHYMDPILGARFGLVNLAAKHGSANLTARFQY